MEVWPDCFIPEDRDLGTHWVSRVGPGGGPDVMPREKSLLLTATDTHPEFTVPSVLSLHSLSYPISIT
jgi:hypothetical protein